MRKSRELVPFSNPKPLVPGAPRGRPGYWQPTEEPIKPLNEHIRLYRDHLIAAGKRWHPLRTCLYDVLEFHKVIGEERGLPKVVRRQVDRYLRQIREKYGPEKTGRKEKAVREFYEFLRQVKLVGSNPFLGLRPRKDGGQSCVSQFTRRVW
jgi:site-specific recombinase XerD